MAFPGPVDFISRAGALSVAFLVLSAGALVNPSPAQERFEEWLEEERSEYQTHLNEQDAAFQAFLSDRWNDVEVDRSAAPDVTDKPRKAPRATSAEASKEGSADSPGEKTVRSNTERSDESRPAPAAMEEAPSDASARPPEERASDKAAESAEETSALERELSLSFYDTPVKVPYASALAPTLDGAPRPGRISAFWEEMAAAPYEPLVDAVQEQRDVLDLGDWGYYRYLRHLAGRLYEAEGQTEPEASAELWTWFMLVQSGYDARVAYQEETAHVLLPIDQKLYNKPKVELEGRSYYLATGPERLEGGVRTYEGTHERASERLELEEHAPPALAGEAASRTVSFPHDGQQYEVDVAYNTAVVDYLSDYPTAELSITFEAGMSPTARSSLAEALGPHLEGRPPRDALNFLLRFVQFATAYETDHENFGETRFLFPEESLAAEASDCDDRAPLFAYLVRTFVERDVVGLKWSGTPGHVATAVRSGGGLDPAPDDRTMRVDGDTYILADPTYLRGTLGMQMPFLGGHSPTVIDLDI